MGAVTGANPFTSKLAVSGAGFMSVTGGTIQIGVAQTTVNAANNDQPTLDLTALTGVGQTFAFSANVPTFNIGQGSDTGGIVLLSNTSNNIIATTLEVGDSAGNNQGSNSTLTLGTGTNVIQADTINLAFSKATGTINFASQTAGSPGTVVITNKAGSGLPTLRSRATTVPRRALSIPASSTFAVTRRPSPPERSPWAFPITRALVAQAAPSTSTPAPSPPRPSPSVPRPAPPAPVQAPARST